ncbi:uncharacterized protein LOC128732380 [Sabethes cyaneus]|uniref:uncharacterized protein LOC128732380 n=1 Tax=Sabethes cyaneus TaxID=53552 RepID=UPI00237E937F|nr:uncharacterized protein LOC128732380 [Sabethes cyaneus]
MTDANGSNGVLLVSNSSASETDATSATNESSVAEENRSVTFPRILDASVPEIYRSEYPVTQVNGCRQYGPPRTWEEPTPGFGCEVYVKRIPPEFTEAELVPIFERFGRIYEMRLMMDYNNQNRRYCFVRYTTEDDAKVAIEVLNHCFIRGNQVLEVQKSFEKCRLFVGNLPKELDRKTIEIAFRSLFPEMTRFVMHNRIADGAHNRGFAFMDFPDHAAALRAKKQTTPGCMRIWDRDIKIVWANPQKSLDHSGVDEVKTLFVRNIASEVTSKDLYTLFVRLVPRNEIIKISRVREFAFVEFARRESAEVVMFAAQGYTLNKFQLDIEWAMPPLRNSFHNMKNYDFNSLLKTKCIANGWDPPIIIFGRVFQLSCLQYAAVIMRQKEKVHVYFVEIHITGLADIQSRICETIIAQIVENGTLSEHHLVIKLKQDSLMIVGTVSSLTYPSLSLAKDVDKSVELFWNEIVDLCEATSKLVPYPFDDLYLLYSNEFDFEIPFPYMECIKLKDRIFGCLHQSYRNRPLLNRKLDNREIVFVLCDQLTLTNYNFSKNKTYIAEPLSALKGTGTSAIKCKTMAMLPANIVQACYGRELNIGAVYFGLNPYAIAEVPDGLRMCMAKPERQPIPVDNRYRHDGDQPLEIPGDCPGDGMSPDSDTRIDVSCLHCVQLADAGSLLYVRMSE